MRGWRFILSRNFRRGLIRKLTKPILVYGDRYVVVKRVTFYDVIDATGFTYGESVDLLAFLTGRLVLGSVGAFVFLSFSYRVISASIETVANILILEIKPGDTGIPGENYPVIYGMRRSALNLRRIAWRARRKILVFLHLCFRCRFGRLPGLQVQMGIRISTASAR